MRLNAEKIKILKELFFMKQPKGILKDRTGIEWHSLTAQLKWLRIANLIQLNASNFPHLWEITTQGIEAIEKWDLDGTPGKLFEEVKE